MNKKLLIVCSNFDYGTALAKIISRSGFETFAIHFDELHHFVNCHEFGAILIDVNLPGSFNWKGFEMAKGLLRLKNLSFIGITADYRDYYEADLINGGFKGYILRNMAFNDIIATIKKVIETKGFTGVPEKYKQRKPSMSLN